MKGLKYTSLAVAALTATLLASTNNSKVQAATVDKNNTVTVAKSDKDRWGPRPACTPRPCR